MPKPVQFSQAVPASTGLHAAGAGRTVDVRTKRRFDLLGLQWRGARTLRVELRVQRDGRWTRWTQAAASDDGPDGTAKGSGRTSSDPIWVGGGGRVQLRLSRPVTGLRLRLINTTGSATAAARARTRAEVQRRGQFGAASATPSAGMPPIIPRADWGAARCRPRVTPSYGSVRVAYVHHTVSLNSYSRSRAASVVLGICLFHRNSNGWNDIGYDFLIDRFGRVFEGRAGGVDAPVIGAQAGGFNGESTGVSMIGNFTSSPPPRAAMNALARLLAWKLGLHGVPAIGKTQVTSAGGSSTGYRAGTRVTVNRISGHRDVDLTSCPGTALYRRLPALRRAVARLEGPISTLTAGPFAQRTPYGAGFVLNGTLTVPGGRSPDGAQIEIRRHADFGSNTVATTSAGPDGNWSALVPPAPANSQLGAVFAGGGGRPGTVSGTAYVDVVPQVTLAASPTALPAGGAVTASGTVAPAKRQVTVTAYLQRPDGTERRAAHRTVRVVRGSYSAGLRLKSVGNYRLVARVAADGSSLSGQSQPVTVAVVPAA